MADSIPIVMATSTFDATNNNHNNYAPSSMSNGDHETYIMTQQHQNFPIPDAQVVTIDEPSNEVTPLVMSSPPSIRSSESVGNNSHYETHYSSSSFHREDGGGIVPPPPIPSSMHKDHETVPRFRDWPFAILFWIHLGVVMYLGIVYSSEGYARIAQDFNWTQVEQEALVDSNDVTPEDFAKFEQAMEEAYEYVQGYIFRVIWYTELPACIAALVFVDVVLTWFMRPCARFVVTKTLIASMTLAFIGIVALWSAQPSFIGLVFACILLGAITFFTYTVWPLIPFVSINLKVALDGIGHNLGTYLWAIFFSYVCVAWVLFWFYTVLGLSFLIDIRCEDRLHPDENVHMEKGDDDECSMSFGIFLLLVISLSWTTNVIVNYLRCTVAGVMATWLYAKEDARCCCSSAVWGSLMRSATYSFGSICFGSLVQGIASFLRWITASSRRNRNIRNNDDACCGGICFCISDCIANVGGDLLDYFSQWNYIYIALYGFSYVESGRAVMHLFHFKGWHLNMRGSQSIISERLTSYVLGWITFGMGILSGLSVLLTERIVTWVHPDPEYDSYVYGPLPQWRVFAFIIGFIIGIVIASILMHVVKGAVNTLIVCWADNRSQIEREHPEFGNKLIEAWSKSFPHSVTMDQNFGTAASEVSSVLIA